MENPKSKYYQIQSKSKIQNPKSERVYDIRERIFRYGQRILDIADNLPSTKVCDVLKSQIVRSGTSIGANMEEADGTLTKRDFINKVVLARKEAKETRFWLRLIADKYIKKEKIERDVNEIQEIINILSAIINKTRNT
jgi:four helix bundle protein